MGFSTVLSNLRTDVLSDAVSWLSDFEVLIALFVGMAAVGILVGIVKGLVR